MGVQERREREKEYRKNQILSAAEKLFLTYGYENVTMDGIAKECELSKGTLYLYYKSKEELFYTLVIKEMDILINMFRESIKNEDDLINKLRNIGKTYLDFYYKYPGYFKILNYMGDHKNFNRDNVFELEKELTLKNKELWSIDVELLEEGKKRGIFKKDFDSFEFSLMIWAASNSLINLLDHLKSNANLLKDMDFEDYPFLKINFENTIYNLWERLISSILEKPDINLITNENKKES